nr:2689_t:CDS:2 [Entrophospora candida]
MASYEEDSTVKAYLSSIRNKDDAGIQSALSQEAIYRSLFAQSRDNSILSRNYLNMINVYENNDIWLIDSHYDDEIADENSIYIMPLPEKKRKKSGEFAICKDGIEKFTRNWKLFTEGSLADLDWSNVFAAGGSVLSCLLPIPEEYNVSPRKIREYYHDKMYGSSDIDLFIYGLDEKAAMEKMLNIYDAVSNSVPWEVICIRSKNCITITSQYPYRYIQIVLRLYKSPSEILTGFDIGCCCVGFDGKDVWALPRAHQAIIKQCNFVDLSRRSPSYEMRLAKYSDRGFEIKVQNLDRKRIDPTIYERSFEKLHGLARLLVLEKLNTPDERFGYAEKKRERSLRPNHPKAGTYASRTWQRRSNMGSSRFENSDYETVSIPYGPRYTAKRIRKLLYTKV